MALDVLFVILLFAIVSVPLFIGAVTFVNRATGGREEELEELKRRVEKLESERE